jgi:hypothetical protein
MEENKILVLVYLGSGKILEQPMKNLEEAQRLSEKVLQRGFTEYDWRENFKEHHDDVQKVSIVSEIASFDRYPE